VREFEKCVNDISNWYVRINRRRFWSDVFDTEKQDAYNSLYFAIKRIAQVMAPVTPFMSEFIWQSTVRGLEPEAESIFLSNFPESAQYDGQILAEAEQAREITARVLKLRNEKNIKVKQPLSVLYLGAEFKNISAYAPVIRDELNVKEIEFIENFGDLSGGNFKDRENIAKSSDGFPAAINTGLTRELKAEGIYRELLRKCQVLRKDAGFAVTDKVTLHLETESETVREVIRDYEKEIMRETLSVLRYVDKPVLSRDFILDSARVVISVG
jgi:isoleucyl-tRNA synthetase